MNKNLVRFKEIPLTRVSTHMKTKKRTKIPLKKHRNLSPDQKLGINVGNLTTTIWRSQKNASKVYVGGYRVHHGPVGLALTLLGLGLKNDFLVGFGESIVKDDLDDASHWLDFEREPISVEGFA